MQLACSVCTINIPWEYRQIFFYFRGTYDNGSKYREGAECVTGHCEKVQNLWLATVRKCRMCDWPLWEGAECVTGHCIDNPRMKWNSMKLFIFNEKMPWDFAYMLGSIKKFDRTSWQLVAGNEPYMMAGSWIKVSMLTFTCIHVKVILWLQDWMKRK
jgi:hypothetical protein